MCVARTRDNPSGSPYVVIELNKQNIKALAIKVPIIFRAFNRLSFSRTPFKSSAQAPSVRSPELVRMTLTEHWLISDRWTMTIPTIFMNIACKNRLVSLFPLCWRMRQRARRPNDTSERLPSPSTKTTSWSSSFIIESWNWNENRSKERRWAPVIAMRDEGMGEEEP